MILTGYELIDIKLDADQKKFLGRLGEGWGQIKTEWEQPGKWWYTLDSWTPLQGVHCVKDGVH